MVRPYGGEYVFIRSHSTHYHTLNKLLHIQFVAIFAQASLFFLPSWWLPQLAEFPRQCGVKSLKLMLQLMRRSFKLRIAIAV